MCQLDIVHIGKDVVCPVKPTITYFMDNFSPYTYGGEMLFNDMCTANTDSTKDDYANKIGNQIDGFENYA